jgi:hypothetical protein
MDVEDLLRETLGPRSQLRPSPDFEDRVTGSLPSRRHGRRAAHLVEVLAAAAVVTALAAVLLPWMIGPRSGGGGPDASESQSAEPLQQTAPGLAQGRIWYFEFDYPAAWALRDGGTANLTKAETGKDDPTDHEPAYVALGTLGSVSETCDRAYAELFVDHKSAAKCTATWNLTNDSAAVTFEWNPQPPSGLGYEPWNLLRAESAPPSGTQLVMVADVRAIYARNNSNQVPISPTVANDATIPGADEVLTWELVDRFVAFNGFKITAAIRGPNTADLEAQIQAVIASLHYVPAIVPLPTDEASKTAALEQFFKSAATASPAPATNGPTPVRTPAVTRRDLSCFAHTPGVTRTATITEADTARLSKPLTVRCTTQIEMVPEQLWKVTLTWEWDAAPDHAAGKAVEVFHNDPTMDGAAIETTGFETMPYLIPDPPGNG